MRNQVAPIRALGQIAFVLTIAGFCPVSVLAAAPTCENLFRTEDAVKAEAIFENALDRWKKSPPPVKQTQAPATLSAKSKRLDNLDFELNFKTSVLRSIPRSAEPGQADVFFTDSRGHRLPSLSEESGYRFNNVVALSDVLYAAEVAKGSPRGREGELTFFDYDPGTSSFHRIIEFQGFEREQNQAAAIFRDPRNRNTAQAVVLESGLLEITTQTHSMRVETPEAMQNEFGGGLWIHEVPAQNVARTRVLETAVETQADPTFLRVLPGSRATVGLHSMEGDVLKSWDLSELSTVIRAFHTTNGFIVQTTNVDGTAGNLLLLKENGRAERLIETDPQILRLKKKLGPIAWGPAL